MNARTIDHQQAIQGMMAERYLLGELTESDLDVFEAHMFNCAICFEQVRAGTELVQYLEQVGAEDPLPAAPSRWRQMMGVVLRPAPALAFAGMFLCLTGFTVYQGVALKNQEIALQNQQKTIRQITAPHIVDAAILHLGSRAEAPPVTPPPSGNFGLHVKAPLSKTLNAYQVRITEVSGKEIVSVPVPEGEDDIQLHLNAAWFQSGKYKLSITATDPATGHQETVGDSSFELKLQD